MGWREERREEERDEGSEGGREGGQRDEIFPKKLGILKIKNNAVRSCNYNEYSTFSSLQCLRFLESF